MGIRLAPGAASRSILRLVVGGAVLLAAALAGSCVPARRAIRVDPAVVLRESEANSQPTSSTAIGADRTVPKLTITSCPPGAHRSTRAFTWRTPAASGAPTKVTGCR